MRWEGAKDPVVWIGLTPDVDPRDARRELARRYLHIFGPTTVASFADWAGVRPAGARSAFDALCAALVQVRTPIGDSWILAEDEAELRAQSGPAAPARLLPSGDTYYLLWGAERELLVPDAKRARPSGHLAYGPARCW